MSSTFTTLPLEVRNEIYSHVFGYDSIMLSSSDTGKHLLLFPSPQKTDGFYGKSDPQRILAILYVNHQISNEAAAYFYGKTTFRIGEWGAVTAFIKGIGARRRDMVKSVTISYPNLLALRVDNGETFELLSRLPGLRKVRVSTSVQNFTQLQNDLTRGGILEFAGEVEIAVYNTHGDTKVINSTPCVKQLYNDKYVWRCARGTTQWTGGERIRKITAQFQWENGRWLSIDNS